MKARDVMSKTVVTVTPDTTIGDVARLMSEKRISGMPVVTADGKVVGVISESDLLHRSELGTEKQRNWWLRVFAEPDRLAREYAKAHGNKVADVMTSNVLSVSADDDLAKVAEILERHKVKRLPVVDGGKLVGVITRGDLVRALVGAGVAKPAAISDSAAVQHAIETKLREQRWLDASMIRVIATDIEVQLWGFVTSDDQRKALRVLASEHAGGRKLEDRLSVSRLPVSGT
ncbi:MAG TPA: CBS domain-containing protein [Hyphomicrobiaceae bacterium]|nr:CBS domain-containing protein [Hyphomicrobiaceae bacterium]